MGGSKTAATRDSLRASPSTFSPTDQASQEEAQRAWTVVRDLPPGEVVCAADPGCGVPGGGGDGRPNGWATFHGDVPEPPPPPRTSTLRKEKKVTILEQAVQRL